MTAPEYRHFARTCGGRSREAVVKQGGNTKRMLSSLDLSFKDGSFFHESPGERPCIFAGVAAKIHGHWPGKTE